MERQFSVLFLSFSPPGSGSAFVHANPDPKHCLIIWVGSGSDTLKIQSWIRILKKSFRIRDNVVKDLVRRMRRVGSRKLRRQEPCTTVAADTLQPAHQIATIRGTGPVEFNFVTLSL